MRRRLAQPLKLVHRFCSSTEGVLAAYGRLVQDGRLRPDSGQATSAQMLQSIQSGLNASTTDHPATGAYLWGPVGSGKSMLMDLLFRTTTGGTRIHYHELMQSIHQGMHTLQEAQPLIEVTLPGGRKIVRRAPFEGDLVTTVAQQVAARAGKLLCIDEMQVTDVADAMVLKQFLEELLSNGVNMVFTSNVPPAGLYAAPYLQHTRKFFLPCIELLQNELSVCRVGDPNLDYRTIPKSKHDIVSSLISDVPLGCWTLEPLQLSAAWRANPAQDSTDLDVGFGRQLTIREGSTADLGGRAAWLDADAVLWGADGHAWGPPDFLAIATNFDTIFLSDLRAFEAKDLDEARRAVLLIDATYEARVRLMCNSSCRIKQLFSTVATNEECTLDQKLMFLRARSRLVEMTGAALS